MIGDSTIADLDDGRIGLRARARLAGGTVCPSYFRLIRDAHPPEQAIVSGVRSLLQTRTLTLAPEPRRHWEVTDDAFTWNDSSI